MHWCAKVSLLLIATAAGAQDFTQRGFWETRLFGYPDTTRNDSGNAVGDTLFRYEATRKWGEQWHLYGTFDARTDTHQQVEREWRFNVRDRRMRRPAFSLRRFSASYHNSHWTIEAGKQFIRWGRADLLNPTDRFAPRDFLNVVDSEFLGVTALRVKYERGDDSVEAVWTPFFTPSRMPLLNQRWAAIPSNLSDFRLVDAGARYPDGQQAGVRWHHIGKQYESSLMFYEGRNHLPIFDAAPRPEQRQIDLVSNYPHLRQIGGDFSVPTRWFTLKTETAYYMSRTKQSDEYIIYVAQLERQLGELLLVGGYAGETVTERRNPLNFSPDRGYARSFLGRASYTIDPRRSVGLEFAVRQNGAGIYSKAEYSQQVGMHWRVTGALAVIRGREDDFLGQYRRNSFGSLALRYSF